MWKLRRLLDGECLVLKVIGRIEADELSELRKAIALEAETRKMVLDLAEVHLAGREAVAFLAKCEEQGARLRNCPAYLRDWITRERDGGQYK
jgi:anti-anti-sigma regulatory factor